jgi:hypothetical protein
MVLERHNQRRMPPMSDQDDRNVIELNAHMSSRLISGNVKIELTMDNIYSLVEDLSPLDSFSLLHRLAGNLTDKHLAKLRDFTPDGFDKIVGKMDHVVERMKKVKGT